LTKLTEIASIPLLRLSHTPIASIIVDWSAIERPVHLLCQKYPVQTHLGGLCCFSTKLWYVFSKSLLSRGSLVIVLRLSNRSIFAARMSKSKKEDFQSLGVKHVLFASLKMICLWEKRLVREPLIPRTTGPQKIGCCENSTITCLGILRGMVYHFWDSPLNDKVCYSLHRDNLDEIRSIVVLHRIPHSNCVGHRAWGTSFSPRIWWFLIFQLQSRSCDFGLDLKSKSQSLHTKRLYPREIPSNYGKLFVARTTCSTTFFAFSRRYLSHFQIVSSYFGYLSRL